jgi:hypothetical protein
MIIGMWIIVIVIVITFTDRVVLIIPACYHSILRVRANHHFHRNSLGTGAAVVVVVVVVGGGGFEFVVFIPILELILFGVFVLKFILWPSLFAFSIGVVVGGLHDE